MTILNKVSNKTLMPGITPISDVPDAPTIGSATSVNGTSVTVAYTAAATGGTATTFTATSTPGSITGTGTSPITVSGLTTGVAYTFKVKGTNSTATGAESSASNSATPTAVVGNWTTSSTSFSGLDTRQILGNGAGLGVVFNYSGSASGNVFNYTSNGTTWSSASVPYGSLGGCWDGTYFWALSYAPNPSIYYYSTTGASWTTGNTNISTNFSNMAFGATKYVGVDRNSQIHYSSNGTSYTTVSGIATSDERVRFNPASSTFIVHNGNATTGTHLTSTNGTSWTSRNSPVNMAFLSVANGLFFANGTGSTSTYYTSTDGITWTTRATLPTSAAWTGFTYVNGYYVATGTTTSAYSTDGINWTTKAFSPGTGIGNPPSTIGNYAVQVSDSSAPNAFYLNIA